MAVVHDDHDIGVGREGLNVRGKVLIAHLHAVKLRGHFAAGEFELLDDVANLFKSGGGARGRGGQGAGARRVSKEEKVLRQEGRVGEQRRGAPRHGGRVGRTCGDHAGGALLRCCVKSRETWRAQRAPPGGEAGSEGERMSSQRQSLSGACCGKL